VSSALPEAGRKRIVEAAVERRVVQRSGFFFQAEDGIRGFHVTGVQTCALPISGLAALDELNSLRPPYGDEAGPWLQQINALLKQIGRASCREAAERPAQRPRVAEMPDAHRSPVPGPRPPVPSARPTGPRRTGDW